MAVAEEHLGVLSDLEVLDSLMDVRDQFLVDAGCGDMHLSRSLAERGAHVLALDPDPVQAAKNRQAPTIAHVGFVESGAESIPVENQSVDGVFFPHSLHHVPASLYPAVFDEVLRVLKPDGYLYVLEPVAAGDLNEIMRLFHDEQRVREQAQRALDTLAIPHFRQARVLNYSTPVAFESWEDYANRYGSKSYNTHYTEADVRADPVRQRFVELGEPRNFKFETPKKVTLLSQPLTRSNRAVIRS